MYAKPAFIEARNFACVAEAVAHYANCGFFTFEEYDRVRIMRNNDGREVRIVHRGLLDVEATEVEL